MPKEINEDDFGAGPSFCSRHWVQGRTDNIPELQGEAQAAVVGDREWHDCPIHKAFLYPSLQRPYSSFLRMKSFYKTYENNILFVPLLPFSIANFAWKQIAHFPDSVTSSSFYKFKYQYL